MCFKTSVSGTTSTATTYNSPIDISTTSNSTLSDEQAKARKKQRTQAGYSSTIQSDSSGGTSSSNVATKTLLGQ